MEVALGHNVGEFDTVNGGLKEDPVCCAFSGKFVRGVHSNRERIADTPYFYRVLADELHKVTDEWRAEFAAAVKAAFVKSGEPVAVAPKVKAKTEEKHSDS